MADTAIEKLAKELNQLGKAEKDGQKPDTKKAAEAIKKAIEDGVLTDNELIDPEFKRLNLNLQTILKKAVEEKGKIDLEKLTKSLDTFHEKHKNDKPTVVDGSVITGDDFKDKGSLALFIARIMEGARSGHPMDSKELQGEIYRLTGKTVPIGGTTGAAGAQKEEGATASSENLTADETAQAEKIAKQLQTTLAGSDDKANKLKATLKEGTLADLRSQLPEGLTKGVSDKVLLAALGTLKETQKGPNVVAGSAKGEKWATKQDVPEDFRKIMEEARKASQPGAAIMGALTKLTPEEQKKQDAKMREQIAREKNDAPGAVRG